MRTGDASWLEVEDFRWRYHLQQYDEPFRATVRMIDLLQTDLGMDGDTEWSILDLGAGAGANVLHFAHAFPNCDVHGVDIVPELIDRARIAQANVANTSFSVADIRRADYLGTHDLVTSLQVLPSLDFEDSYSVLRAHFEHSHRAVALTTLLSEADIDREVRVHDYEQNAERFLHVFSLPRYVRIAEEAGFRLLDAQPFAIDVDVPASPDGRDHYTVGGADGRRLMFSGVQYLPWWHMVFESTCEK